MSPTLCRNMDRERLQDVRKDFHNLEAKHPGGALGPDPLFSAAKVGDLGGFRNRTCNGIFDSVLMLAFRILKAREKLHDLLRNKRE